MAFNNFTDMLGEVQPHCGGAPESVVVNAIRNAWIDFLDMAWCWQVETDPMPISKNVADYTIDSTVLPTNSAVAEILYVYFNGVAIDPITKADVLTQYPYWKTQTGTAPKCFMAGDAKTKVTLIPIPNNNGTVPPPRSNLIGAGLSFSLALKPTRASTTVPAFLYERYMEDVAHGAISRVLAIPHKVWSNANVALAQGSMFRDRANVAQNDAIKSFTRANLRNRQSGVARW